MMFVILFTVCLHPKVKPPLGIITVSCPYISSEENIAYDMMNMKIFEENIWRKNELTLEESAFSFNNYIVYFNLITGQWQICNPPKKIRILWYIKFSFVPSFCLEPLQIICVNKPYINFSVKLAFQ